MFLGCAQGAGSTKDISTTGSVLAEPIPLVAGLLRLVVEDQRVKIQDTALQVRDRLLGYIHASGLLNEMTGIE